MNAEQMPPLRALSQHIPTGDTVWGYKPEDLIAYAVQEVAKERERCAKLCDGVIDSRPGLCFSEECAARIRASTKQLDASA